MGIPSMFDRVAFVSDRFFHGAKVLIVLRKMAESFLQRRVHTRADQFNLVGLGHKVMEEESNRVMEEEIKQKEVCLRVIDGN